MTKYDLYITKQNNDAMATMTPSKSPITEGQISKFSQNLIARLLKCKTKFTKDGFQRLLGDEMVLHEIVDLLLKRIGTIDTMFVRTVKVNRSYKGTQAFNVTGRMQWIMDFVLEEAPKGTSTKVDVFFFKPDKKMYTGDDLKKEYDLRGLLPVDPYVLAAVHENDPGFADEKPNGTYWIDKRGFCCFASFHYVDTHSSCPRRALTILNDGPSSSSARWFAGVRKKNI